MTTHQADLAIIGGGIVGLATAYRLSERYPDHRVVLLEKEAQVAQHQTGHNSGVLHSGIYYKPGSLKALNCRAGKAAMEAFCAREGVPYDLCGKVIVAVTESERPALHRIFERGQANGVACTLVGPERLAELEPSVQGVEAIHVPESGIVDYGRVSQRLAARIQERGVTVWTRATVNGIVERGGRVVVTSTRGAVEVQQVINCAGLYSDRIAGLAGAQPTAQIVPFRGEYYELTPAAESLCRGLIYPVPDPAFPFLGVHFTRMIHGGVECGPNAVLAFAREGYTFGTVNWRDLLETLTYPGFLKLAARYWQTGLGEMWRSLSKAAFVTALQRLVPAIRAEHLVAAPAGVRAQAVTPAGAMVDDFAIRETPQALHVLNAPSPAATASLNIGSLVVDRLAPRLGPPPRARQAAPLSQKR
ncbi:MAG: L-2-hydroxyglutarate oxidase [Bacteroidota bacterium]